MIRKLLIAFGLFEIARPRTVVDLCERIGLENPEAAELRSGAEHLARLEGVAVVALLWRRGRGSGPAALLFGAAGVAAVLAPDPLIRLTQRVAYRNTDDLELKPWIGPAARTLGVLYLLVTVLAWQRRDGDATGASADVPETGAADVRPD